MVTQINLTSIKTYKISIKLIKYLEHLEHFILLDLKVEHVKSLIYPPSSIYLNIIQFKYRLFFTQNQHFSLDTDLIAKVYSLKF